MTAYCARCIVETGLVIRRTALLLVLVLSMGAVRVLTCELGCADAATKPDATCHEGGEAATTLLNGASHQCDYGAMAPSLTAQQKPIVSPQPAVVFVDLRAGAPLLSTTRDEFFVLPPGAPPVSLSRRTPALRI